MSTTLTTKGVLAALGESNQIITLGIALAGEIVPLAKGIVKEIRSISTGTETVSYEILIVADGKELDAVHQLAEDDLAAINAELAKLGQKPIPPAPPITQ